MAKEVINVDLGERSYDITVEAGLLRNCADLLARFTAKRKCLLATDSNVGPLYAESVQMALDHGCEELVVPAGEQYKTLETVANFYHAAIQSGLDRKSSMIALGGGVCGDMTGFAAATYMRGIDFIQIPTSLLAMVDSSVGGKTGVDLPEGKNLVGAFWQPRGVIIDPEVLRTLPFREVRCGLAEIVKYAVIVDAELFDDLEQNIDKLNSLDLEYYTAIIARCCRIKAAVVAEDEREGGLRAILNYGHTFGHAIERVSEFSIGHGEGVSIGMVMAAELAVKLDMLEADAALRQKALLQKLGLPVACDGIGTPEEIFSAMFSDKKKEGNVLTLILPDKIGSVKIVKDVDNDSILDAVRSVCD